MKPGGGKHKGASFERQVCVQLSRVVDPDGEDTIFWRSAISGARATVQNRKGVINKTQLGDVSCVHTKGEWLTKHFIIECKNYSNMQVANSLIKSVGRLATFWRALCKLCLSHNKAPMLIFKEHGSDVLFCTTTPGLHRLDAFGYKIEPILYSRMMERRYGYVYLCRLRDLK